MGFRPGIVALFLLLPLVPAAAAADGSALLKDELRFADNLARYRYFDLAFEVLGQVKLNKLSADDKGTVDLTEARLNRKASEATADVERQLAFQTAACELLMDWAQPGTALVYHERRPEALKEYADVLQARARLRAAQRLAAEPGQVEALRALADADFKKSDEIRVLLHREYEDIAQQRIGQDKPDEAREFTDRAALTLYERGLNSLDWADVASDREFRLEQADELLADYQWELEEETLAQSFAIHYQGVVQRKLGQVEDALELQREVLEKGQWYWDNRMDDPVAAAFIAELFDRAWGEIASLQAEQGDLDAAGATVDTMLSAHSKADIAWGRSGLQVLLNWATQLQELGNAARALDIVKLVADKGAGLPEGTRANDLLATLVAGTPATTDASPNVLMAAAKGLLDRKDYAEAAFVYSRAAAAVRTEQERKDFLVEAWLGAGRAYAADKHALEAALAFEQALDAAVAVEAGEALRDSAAINMYNNFVRRLGETNDPFDKALKDDANARLIKMGVSADLAFLNAKDAFDAASGASPPDPAAFLAAFDELQSIKSDAPSYERALVYQGRALAGAGKLPEALAAFDVLLKRAADPSLAPANADARNRREVALGEAHYYKADLLLSPEVNRPADALTLLSGFESRFPGQAGLAESVKFQRVTAHALLGDVEAASKAVADLAEFAKESNYLRVAWYRLSDALLKASDAAFAKPDEAAGKALLKRAADALWASAELGGFSSFVNLTTTGDWYMRADSPDSAQRSYAKALDVFDREGSGVSANQLDEARLGLGLAYNALKEFGRARPYWQDLVKRKPSDVRVLTGAARGFGGWLELGPDGAVVEVPGSGDFGDAFDLWATVFKSARASTQYQRPWWESKLGTIYAKYRQGAANPQSYKDARDLLNNVAVFLPNFDEDTAKDLPADQQYQPLFKPFFKYLEKKIPTG